MKYFMTVGDWTARVWMEDLKSPLMTTPYDGSYLTGGCWSPTRPGVFFTTKTNGTMDVWDYHYKQNEPTFSTKIGEAPLTSIRVQSHGKLVALGSDDGTVNIMQISSALSEPQPGEKFDMQLMLERETKREKNLEARYLQKKRDHKDSKPAAVKEQDEGEDDETKELIRKCEEDFFAQIDTAKAKEDAAEEAARGSEDATRESESAAD